jgi:hypothetical protein
VGNNQLIKEIEKINQAAAGKNNDNIAAKNIQFFKAGEHNL